MLELWCSGVPGSTGCISKATCREREKRNLLFRRRKRGQVIQSKLIRIRPSIHTLLLFWRPNKFIIKELPALTRVRFSFFSLLRWRTTLLFAAVSVSPRICYLYIFSSISVAVGLVHPISLSDLSRLEAVT